MKSGIIKDVEITPLKIISHEKGNIYHAIKKNEASFYGFAEAYFSSVNYQSIKAWKRHTEMTMNLIVPIGKIKLVIIDDRHNKLVFQEIELSLNNYNRITIPPMLWTGFKGLSTNSAIILNIANLLHDANEIDRLEINDFDYKW
jgi:dTDP-4-dehydrorhamnose 3,5-epimerase